MEKPTEILYNYICHCIRKGREAKVRKMRLGLEMKLLWGRRLVPAINTDPVVCLWHLKQCVKLNLSPVEQNSCGNALYMSVIGKSGGESETAVYAIVQQINVEKNPPKSSIPLSGFGPLEFSDNIVTSQFKRVNQCLCLFHGFFQLWFYIKHKHTFVAKLDYIRSN